MELRTIAYFVAVADAGTVSAAADAVRVTQPALSRQLRGLERELGVDLFERAQGRLRLSPAGRALLPHARDLLERADALRVAADLQARGRLARVTIAAPTTTLTDVVSPFLVTLAPNDPVPAVFASDGLTPDDARRRGADLVLTAGRPHPPFASRPLPPLPVWAYVPPGHRWAAERSVTLGALADEDLVVLPPGHPARQAFDAAVLAAGVALPAAVEASNGTVAQALAAAGRGIAVVSDDPRFDLIPLAVVSSGAAPVSVHLSCAWDARHPAAAVLADLAARIERYVVARYGYG
ncbi:LysR family transcriptional regulator [Cryptosporangium aurantiacum]|uniref:DNA-binding transcriptional regulator, LysR family n=1 Tax=Cryptosporangium aurantiacum TaxID=134849 RepID=A0A1M7TX79_9ACTN|nr:LysR family transcriptional regulator [Cryptosporangium aurantiacum]SHN75354.1 DNA-binding transcriptional regulator, LysR family [Cryptosporangium aurantiacum]